MRRIWTVRDFAEHAYGATAQADLTRARRFLLALDAKHGGKLLIPSAGANRRFHVLPATLARLEPTIFPTVATAETRLDELEEQLAETRSDLRRTTAQVAVQTRAVARKRRSE